MRIALHPIKNEQITIDEYIKEFGHRPILQSDNRKRARCPFCMADLNDVAGKTRDTIGHFAHFPESNSCPSKEPAGKPYLRLTPTASDPERSKELKNFFLNRWDLYYSKLRELIPYLSKSEFLALIQRANKLRIWEYRHLMLWEIPYVFVLLNDFPGTCHSKIDNGKCRKYWFRFWYDSSINELSDLWINRHSDPVLFRASFIQPGRRGVTPGIEKMVKFNSIQRDINYLDRPLPRSLPEWLSKGVENVLPSLLGVTP
jgi:hypothetical protein